MGGCSFFPCENFVFSLLTRNKPFALSGKGTSKFFPLYNRHFSASFVHRQTFSVLYSLLNRLFFHHILLSNFFFQKKLAPPPTYHLLDNLPDYGTSSEHWEHGPNPRLGPRLQCCRRQSIWRLNVCRLVHTTCLAWHEYSQYSVLQCTPPVV